MFMESLTPGFPETRREADLHVHGEDFSPKMVVIANPERPPRPWRMLSPYQVVSETGLTSTSVENAFATCAAGRQCRVHLRACGENSSIPRDEVVPMVDLHIRGEKSGARATFAPQPG